MNRHKKTLETRQQHRSKRPRTLALLFAVLMLCAASPFLINASILSESGPYILTLAQAKGLGVDCILVLGAGVWGEGRPSLVLQDRLSTGIALYMEGVSDRLLMSGDHGREEYDEVNTMKAYAVARDVPSSHIFMDHAGFSTYESMVRAKEVFGVQSAVIVTQGFHLPRAIYIARKLGIHAYGVNADLNTYAGQQYNNTREFFARIKDYFYVKLRPSPTYLGEAIPVSGNGDLTNDR